MPFYFADLKGDPNSENYPFVRLELTHLIKCKSRKIPNSAMPAIIATVESAACIIGGRWCDYEATDPKAFI